MLLLLLARPCASLALERAVCLLLSLQSLVSLGELPAQLFLLLLRAFQLLFEGVDLQNKIHIGLEQTHLIPGSAPISAHSDFGSGATGPGLGRSHCDRLGLDGALRTTSGNRGFPTFE